MAKACMLAREKVRLKLSTRAASAREKLKAIIKDPSVDYEAKMQAVHELDDRARDESYVRCQSRCFSCGRPRAVYRKFKLCRICLRKFIHAGFLPGAKKASW